MKKFMKALREDKVKKVDELMDDYPGLEKKKLELGHNAAEHGSINVLKKYAQNLVTDYFKNERNVTWLEVALENRKIEIADYILKNFKDQVLYYHSEDSKTIGAIISHDQKGDAKEQEMSFRGAVLHTIIANGFIDLVNNIDVLDFDLLNDEKETILHTAARHGKIGAVHNLISRLEKQELPEESLKRILNAKNSQFETVLHLVGRNSDLETFRILVEKGSDMKIKDSFGNTPLHTLTNSQELASEDIKNFLESKIRSKANASVESTTKADASGKSTIKTNGSVFDLGLTNDAGETLLHICSRKGDKSLVECLVNLGANPSIPDKMENTPLRTASQYGHADIVGYLLEKDTNSSADSVLYDLVCSIETDQDDRVKDISTLPRAYVERSVKERSKKQDKNTETILHVVAANGLTSLVETFKFVDFF